MPYLLCCHQMVIERKKSVSYFVCRTQVCCLSVREQLLSVDETVQSCLQSLQQKDAEIVDLEHRVCELLSSLEMTKTQCQSVFTVMLASE